MHRAMLAVLILPISLSGCDAGRSDVPARERATGRELDSIVAESPLPGARGILRAHQASDAAAARQAVLDSLSR